MERYEELSKADLKRFLVETEGRLRGMRDDDDPQRLLYDLQVHQIELELQNRELREAQQALEASRDRYAELYDFAPVGYVTLDRNGVIRNINLSGARLLGRERVALLETHFGAHLAHGTRSQFLKYLRQAFTVDHCMVGDVRIRPDPEGRIRELRLDSVVRVGHEGEPACLVCLTDISERKRAEARLLLARSALENSPQGIMVTDSEQRIVAVNPAFTRTTGYSEAETLGRKSDLLESGRHDRAFYRNLQRVLARQGRWEGEIWNRRKNGEIYPEWLTISEIRDPAGSLTHYLSLFSDIESQSHIQERLHRLAYYDPLTDLPNRALFRDRFDLLVPQVRRRRGCAALLFLDLDRFKQVNDSLGHPAGDALLKTVAVRLQGCVRESDVVARFGGDEFSVLLPDIAQPRDAEHVAEKIVRSFETPFRQGETEFFVTASIGISCFPMDGKDIDTLIKQADTAMYSAKQGGRNTFRFYRSTLTEESRERLLLSSHLRRAEEKGQLALHYQPQVALSSGRVAAVEAVARWRHPQLGEIPPSRFIPLAEETGIIVSLSEWIMRRAMEEWRANFEHPGSNTSPRLAVNVSSTQFHRQDLLALVAGLLARTGLEARHLELEITESVLMRDADKAARVLAGLERLGVRIAIDDFGTGYSSLSYLSRFPIHTVKIDSSFIANLISDQRQAALVSAVIRMSRDLDFDVVAEGVETVAQLALLEELGCDLVQGYLYRPPMAAAEIGRWLARRVGGEAPQRLADGSGGV